MSDPQPNPPVLPEATDRGTYDALIDGVSKVGAPVVFGAVLMAGAWFFLNTLTTTYTSFLNHTIETQKQQAESMEKVSATLSQVVENQGEAIRAWSTLAKNHAEIVRVQRNIEGLLRRIDSTTKNTRPSEVQP